MAFSALVSQNPFSCLSPLSQTQRRNPYRVPSIRAVNSAANPEKEKLAETKSEEASSAQSATPAPKPLPKKPVYSSEFLKITFSAWYPRKGRDIGR